jgi:signal transduction histidine kinase
MSLSTNASTSEPLVRFVRKLSHDLNNFSTVVRTYSELLLSDLPADSATHADVAEIQRAAENMVQYLQRVTRFARAGSMKRAPVNVDEVAREAAEQFQSRTPSRLLEVRVSSGATIQADVLWWRDVVLELLQNAHEAAPGGTPIGMQIVRNNDEVVVSVIDRGPGFDASVVSHAGEPLVSGKSGMRGAGMGLTIVAAFCGTLGGTLAQTHEDGRTTVTLRLPVA